MLFQSSLSHKQKGSVLRTNLADNKVCCLHLTAYGSRKVLFITKGFFNGEMQYSNMQSAHRSTCFYLVNHSNFCFARFWSFDWTNSRQVQTTVVTTAKATTCTITPVKLNINHPNMQRFCICLLVTCFFIAVAHAASENPFSMLNLPLLQLSFSIHMYNLFVPLH